MPEFHYGGIRFHYRDTNSGIPVVFQHGLGGDVEQPCGLFHPPNGFRLLALDCRAHGQTRPLGDPGKIGIASFADDLAAWLDDLRIERAIVGGISMGAAVTLNFTLRFPERVLGLIQVRPAWLEGPMTHNAEIFGEVAALLRQHGAADALERFRKSRTFLRVADHSPAAAESLVGQFKQPRAEETAVRLERIPTDAPCRLLDELKSIEVPCLVLANRQDPIHPFDYGQTLSQTIPGSEFREITTKSVSEQRHAEDIQHAMTEFLGKHFEKFAA